MPSGSAARLSMRMAAIKLVAIGLPQPFAACDAIAVLGGHRATQAQREPKDLLRDASQHGDTFRRLEVKDGPDVQAARRGMRVDAAFGVMLSQDPFDLAHEFTEAFHRDGTILNEGDRARRTTAGSP